MINVSNLSKKYGKHLANDNISLSVQPGQICILLGPNGAGKSTLIKSICGLLRYDGTITIDGHDNRSIDAKRLLGYVPEFPTPYPLLTVYEHLEFIAKAYRLEDWEARAEDLLARFELDDKRNKLGKELSKGMQQKVSCCCALLPDPKAIIFDEPLVGLDPHGIREVKETIVKLREEGKAVLVSTHLIDSVEQDWDITYIMRDGKVVQECVRGMDGVNDARRLEEIYFGIFEKSPAKETNPDDSANDAGDQP